VEFANKHLRLRAWAIEGTGSHGAGLCRHPSSLERSGRGRLGAISRTRMFGRQSRVKGLQTCADLLGTPRQVSQDASPITCPSGRV
jgi:hypothetical protein